MNTIRVGFIRRAHGVAGVLVVEPLTDDVSRFERIKEVYIERGAQLSKRALLDVRRANDVLHVRLEGVGDRTAAEALRGAYLALDREDAIELGGDSNFIFELIGCAVEDGEGTRYGVLRDVLQYGAADVYVVSRPGGGELMFPALKRLVLSVDVDAKRIVIDPVVLKEVAVSDED